MSQGGSFALDITNVIWFGESLPLKTLHTKGIVYQMQKKYTVHIAKYIHGLTMTTPQNLSQHVATIEDH